MTDETEAKLERIRLLAEEIGKESAYDGIALESLIFLSSREDELDKERLEYFFHGYYYGAKAGRFKTPEDVADYAKE